MIFSVRILADLFNIDLVSTITHSDKPHLYRTGVFLILLFVFFWWALHSIVNYFSSVIAVYLFPTEEEAKVPYYANTYSESLPGTRNRHVEKLSFPVSGKKELTLDTKIFFKRIKFNVAIWKAINYSLMSIVGFRVLSSVHWLRDYYYYAVPQPFIEMPTSVYYNLGIASYFYGLICLLYEPRLKDFPIMVSHHIVTLLLMVGSYYFLGSVRVGMIVLILHDVCDPFMEAAKACNYSNSKLFANLFFILFALVFIISRCILYPIFVILPIFCLLYDVSTTSEYFFTGAAHLIMLCIIFMMDVYWAFLISKMAVNQIINGEVSNDVREEDGKDD